MPNPPPIQDPAPDKVKILFFNNGEHNEMAAQAGFMAYIKQHKLNWHVISMAKSFWGYFVNPRFGTRPEYPVDIVVGKRRALLLEWSDNQKNPIAKLVLQQLDDPDQAHARIDIDHIASTAAGYFRDLGVEHVAAIGGGSLHERNQLNQSFLSAAQAAKLVTHYLDKRSFPLKLNTDIDQAIMDWLRAIPGPVGVFMFNADDAEWLLSLCLRYGVDVPGHALLLSAVDREHITKRTEPSLSAIVVNWREIGQTLAIKTHCLLSGSDTGEVVLTGALCIAERESTRLAPRYGELVNRAIKILRRRKQPITQVSELARLSQSSLRTLQRHFIAETGAGPKQWLQKTMVAFAQEQLATSDIPIEQLAKDCGYSDVPHFTHAFKKLTGHTPAHFRQGLVRPDS